MAAPRISILELKFQIEMKIGRPKANIYFDLLRKFFADKIRKCEFDKLCIAIIGRKNVPLHNQFLLSITKNAHFSKTPPPQPRNVGKSLSGKVTSECKKSDRKSLCEYIPSFPHKVRTPNLRQWRFRVRPSPLGPHGKSDVVTGKDPALKIHQQQKASEIHSLGSGPLSSIEDKELAAHAAKSSSILNMGPITAPLGFHMHTKRVCRAQSKSQINDERSETCRNCGELPDTNSLMKRLKQKVEREGLHISSDSANLLNKSLDAFLKRLIKPCMELANSKSQQVFHEQKKYHMISGSNRSLPVECVKWPSQSNSVSMIDFRAAMDMNPQVLGPGRPAHLENIHVCASED